MSEMGNEELESVAPFKEVTEEIKAAGGGIFRMCYQCGKCDVVCPWNRVREFSMRRLIREAAFGVTEIEGEDLWRCTTCGTCPQECPRGVKQIELGVSLRRVASGYGVFPASVKSARAAGGSLQADGNPLKFDRSKRADWAEGGNVKPFEEGMEILDFVGCYYSFDPRMTKSAVALAQVLDRAGVSFGILGAKENCCGESIRKTGAEDVFRTLAKENIKNFIDAGVKKILVSSPHCYHTFKNEYPEFMVNFDIVHVSQYLLSLVNEGRLKITGEMKKRVAYHDPCYLGRHNGIYDEPRELLRKIPGLDLVELADCREKSLCCGGGGGRIWMETPNEERFSNIRLQQARDAGAEVLATSCPYCITNFEESRLNLKMEDALVVQDLAEIVRDVT